MQSEITRRQLLRAGAAGGAALGASAMLPKALIERALATPTGCGKLDDIEHIVVLIQENRSFDSYFGTFRGVTGYGDTQTATPFAQPTNGQPFSVDGVPRDHLYPYHLDASNNGECTNDITHDWGPQHRAFNGGAMDGFLSEHLKANGQANGPLTMGYYKRDDLPFFHALADAFTICDRYHCSVIGPTDPNRLYSMSATLDPDGGHGGPIVETLVSQRLQTYGKLTWKTMPEHLRDHGVSWKVYEAPENLSPVSDNVLPYFKNYLSDPDLANKAFGQVYPGAFQADVAAGTLPQVSWVVAPVVQSEHPPAPVTWGEQATYTVLESLLANPDLWARTALLVTYDENGGFFDHVAPPVAPSGTAGEYLTASPLPAAAENNPGPIGLGFRVPMLVVSPFSRGGFVCSDVFDHTSVLKLLDARFNLGGVPNLSSWRNGVVGDMTGAFNFAAPDTSVPSLPQPLADTRPVASNCPTNGPVSLIDENGPEVQTYPVTFNDGAPAQDSGDPRRPSGPVPC